MLFNSLLFVVFFGVVYALYRLLPHRGQNLMLLAASYIFYGSWDWRFLSLIALSTVVDYFCGLGIARRSDARSRRLLLFISVASNLGILGFFKYADFFSANLQSLLESLGFKASPLALGLILPVGISFYTFQTMSYTIDIYRGKLEPERRFLDFALFVAFFPQLVAGPIERARHLLPQIAGPRRITGADVEAGAWWVLWGYFLKLFVADNLAPISDAAFAAGARPDGVRVLVGVYAFAFQIFGDFAGYSAIAIGISRLMGFRLMTNFRFPYFVTNPRDFWRHWHISLSTWLRDYLYVPLGGSRGTRFHLYRNLFLTMLLGGLWHGAAWTFVAWGVFQGGVLIAHRLMTGPEGGPSPPSPFSLRRGLAVLVMFHVTCMGWLIFRAESMEQVSGMLSSLAALPGLPSAQVRYDAARVAFHVVPLLLVQLLHRRAGEDPALPGASDRVRVPVAVGLLYLLVLWGEFGGAEFIYFQF